MWASVVVSLVATLLKLVFFHSAFQETRSPALGNSAATPRTLAPGAAMSLLVRDGVILRVALVLVLSSLSFAGLNTVLSPYLTGYLGLTRGAGVGLLLASLGSGALGLAAGVGPLVRGVGEVGALQVCLSASIAFPLLLAGCSCPEQVGVVATLLGAPLWMFLPIVSGIKSNLVREEEQGLVQGALACISNFATATSDVIFGVLYRHVTVNGTDPDRTSVFPLFFVCSVLAAASWLLACSLPRKLPRPSGCLTSVGADVLQPLIHAGA
mmetsp:Transcript_113093/g.365491  ORF Transcript_113093/g.365491 Transcript_113093/m.365491 type:complete len:268 (-) Transcript_113093:311-1114(-)